MARADKYIVGTSGFSFADWVGTFYPPATRRQDMFAHYAQVFPTSELNYTYYRMPAARTLQKLAQSSPDGFTFWVKANQETTHRKNRSVAAEFAENLQPLTDAKKLAGLLLQFPQGFHRTVANRKYLAACLEDFVDLPLAVEFRHRSWRHEATFAGLAERNVTLVVPDVPDLAGLFRCHARLTTRTGYLRLHSRDAAKWYDPNEDRYDYHYSDDEMKQLLHEWAEIDAGADKVFAFFNNCHGGQAAENAEAFRRILDEMDQE